MRNSNNFSFMLPNNENHFLTFLSFLVFHVFPRLDGIFFDFLSLYLCVCVIVSVCVCLCVCVCVFFLFLFLVSMYQKVEIAWLKNDMNMFHSTAIPTTPQVYV